MTNIEKIKAEVQKWINNRTDCTHVAEADIVATKRCAYQDVLNFINSLPEEPIGKNTYIYFKAIPRLLDMIEPSERAKSYISKLADSFDNEGYHVDAKIVRERIKMMNGEKVGMSTMDEDSVGENLEEAAEKYGKELGHILATAIDDDTSFGEYAQESFKAGAQWQRERIINKTCDFIKQKWIWNRQMIEKNS